MTRSKAPPPIKPVKNRPHEKWGDTGTILKRAIETAPAGMSDVRLVFHDEFAPSAAQAFSSDPDAISNPAARHIFYNQHLYDLLPQAIGRAVTLGLPPLDIGFPLAFTKIDTEALGHMFSVCNYLAPSLQEGTQDWLCVQCFIKYALLCNALTEPTSKIVDAHHGESEDHLAFRQRSLNVVMPVTEAFFLGAALRELELTLLNKSDAIRGKKTKKAARAGGEIRRSMTLPETDARRAEMQRLIEAGHTIMNAARLTSKAVGGTVEANRALCKPSRRK